MRKLFYTQRRAGRTYLCSRFAAAKQGRVFRTLDMKKTHIALLVLVAVAVAVIFASFSDFSTYETFASAAAAPQKSIKVVGVLDRSRPVVHDPKKDTEKYIFFVTDKKGATHEVEYIGSKSLYDIEKSENIVMTGKMAGEVFQCSDVQLKCPSKYKDKEQLAAAGS